MDDKMRNEELRGLIPKSLEIAHLRIRLRILSNALLPVFKGSTFRGALGASMLKAWCIAGKEVCHQCRFVSQCPYANFFKPHLARNGKSIPVPFILEPEMDKRTLLQGGDTAEFGLTVVGTALKWLPFVMAALFRGGSSGILGVSRAHFSIEIPRPPEKDGHEALAWEPILSRELEVEDAMDVMRRTTRIRAIRFVTPCKIKDGGRVQGEPDGEMLLKALQTRLRAMSFFYGKDGDPEQIWPWHEKPLLNTGKARLRWVVLERPSRTQRTRINIGGWVGTIPVESHNDPAEAILRLGELLHVGKNTTVGCGKIVLDGGIVDAEVRKSPFSVQMGR